MTPETRQGDRYRQGWDDAMKSAYQVFEDLRCSLTAQTACGMTRDDLHQALRRLDKQAECEAGTHEWGGTPAGMQCRWCRVLVSGPLAEAMWKAIAEVQP